MKKTPSQTGCGIARKVRLAGCVKAGTHFRLRLCSQWRVPLALHGPQCMSFNHALRVSVCFRQCAEELFDYIVETLLAFAEKVGW